MLALSTTPSYHHSSHSWRGSHMRSQSHGIPRTSSALLASSSSSPRPILSSRRTQTNPRRSVARDQPESSTSRHSVVPPASSASPPLPAEEHAPHSPIPTHLSRAQNATPPPSPPVLDIVKYPTTDLLKLLAALLQQIATANDAMRESLLPHSPVSAKSPAPSLDHPSDSPLDESGTSSFSASYRTPGAYSRATALFHARNIPTISIESYLLRILKYCPTTNEVFLSLLVYFDRMSRGSLDTPGSSGIAIDSYNVHRLVIAGITVASKFFSDVFYLNSRYAKVGGLPQSELNQLELQFLLLNDFRLVISPEEMQRYANQLLVYSTTLNPPSPSAQLPPPLYLPHTPSTKVITAVAPSLPTPVPSPHSQAVAPRPSYDDAGESSGYGTTDDEPTIRPSDSSGSSIHTTSSSATTSQATTPATSPARRAIAVARLSSASLHQDMMAQAGDEDADTDGEGDDSTDDEESVYRGRRIRGDTVMGSP